MKGVKYKIWFVFAAIAVGRGHAGGEVGIACVGVYSPNLILSQFSDNQNFTKTLSKINLFLPRKVNRIAVITVTNRGNSSINNTSEGKV